MHLPSFHRRNARAALRAAAAILAAATLLALAAGNAAAATEQHVLVDHGDERTYLLTVPPQAATEQGRLPLVIILHGANQSASVAVSMTRFDQLAADKGFFAVFPDGTNNINRLLTWNALHCCGYAASKGVDDLGFISALLDELIRNYPIDPNRIYVVGFSNGAMLAQLIGITMPDRVAAVGSVMGALFGDEPSPRLPMPAIIINGGRDHIIPTTGGPINGNDRLPIMWDGRMLMSSAYQVHFWARAAGCGDTPTKDGVTPSYVFERYDCPGGTRIDSYIVLDNGHAWPGDQSLMTFGEVPSTTFDATAVIWDFFSHQSLAGRTAAQSQMITEPLPPPAPPEPADNPDPEVPVPPSF